MKKRIWNQLQSVTLAAVLVTGMAGSLWNESVGIRAAELADGFSDSVRLEQSAVWTDEAHFKAQLQIKVSGLHTLRQAVQVESAGNIWDETQREDMIPPEELEALELAEESAEHIETGYPVMGTGRDMGMESMEPVSPVENFEDSVNFSESMSVESMEEMDTCGNSDNLENENYEDIDRAGIDAAGIDEADIDAVDINAVDMNAVDIDTVDINTSDTNRTDFKWEDSGNQEEGYDRVEELDGMEELEGLLSEGTIELSEGEPEKYFLTACLSEYFQIEEAQVPAGTQMETVVIRNQKGEKTELTKLNYPVEISEETEDSFQVTFPVVLREEYQVCAVSVSYPVCQDEPLQKDRAGMGTYFWRYGSAGEMDTVLDECPSEKLSVKAAEAGLSAALQADEEQSGDILHTVTVKAKHPGKEENIGCQTSAKITAAALKAAFEVEKTADRKETYPGETITYQICIRNTGERTLHSVLSTERFLNANIQAQFVQKEGVTLNSTRTQALIPQIAPGEAFALYATVTLPQYFANQELVNEVSVISDETGSETIRSQSNLTVNAPETTLTPTPTMFPVLTSTPAYQSYDSGYGAKTGNAYAAASKPKTGDETETEKFLIIGIFAVISGISGALLKRKSMKNL